MRLSKLLLATTLLSGLALGAAAEIPDRCIDDHCRMQSVHSLDGVFAGAETGGGDVSTVAKRFGTWGIDTSGMDTSVKPGDSFFNYVNGTAVKAMVIPADKTSIGSFIALRDLSEARSNAIVTGLAARTDLTGDDAKIAAVYNAFMDEAAAEKLGAAPLKPRLAAIKAIKTKAEMAKYMGQTSGTFGAAFFNPYVDSDEKNPKVKVLLISQGGLGLPDRDYYLKDSFADKKAKYETYIADMLRLTGHANPEQTAKDILALETKIAEVHWTRIERRDSTKTYNPMTPAELATYAPGFDWSGFLAGASAGQAKKVIVNENTAFPKIAKIFADTPLETLKAWEAFRTADQAAPYLSKAFVERQWQFRSRDLAGAQAQRPRWKRAISAVEGSLGEALGRTYVATYFPPESKAKMETLVADLRVALKARIDNLTWMSAPTKLKAQEKLGKFGVKIGYPEKWRDYSGLTVKVNDLYGNAERSSAFNWAYQAAKIDKPADPLEWRMTPQTVNAYYSPTENEIVFPAAILQPPFFDPEADPAVNYGGIGGVIGHEIGHGFDDQGRNYDGDGVLTDWWTAEDAEKFKVQATKLGAQYDAFEVLPGVHVQGGLTMGENIGDLAGNLLGLDAYRLSLKGQPSPVLDGFTGDQRVFMGFAQVWRSKYRDDTLKQQVTADPHSPAVFRVIGPVRNIDAWYDAFGVKPGDAYYVKPEDRVRIW
ncbi:MULTISPECIES: M13 family metallopeptidase [Asticcacaulis]|uniref:M13 family metallopeptidase n=1 Tax=Asticcacaulis TaxID=76890 RepID=UPI001AE2C35E|nr:MULTISPECIES: M13-type metalloendopeptidase [Asticcacaulis]MBP2157992.1 putative endopeptidase [Asticcacaulis solisilvae]MDR6799037.1 putative endopeptidase [Asticcacaulis sp. BE141]